MNVRGKYALIGWILAVRDFAQPTACVGQDSSQYDSTYQTLSLTHKSYADADKSTHTSKTRLSVTSGPRSSGEHQCNH